MSPGMSQATLNTIKYDDKKRELNQDAAASPSKKAPKNPAVKPAHPPYAVMIAEAIRALKERTGSSRHAILKYILANYKVADADKAQVRAKLAIRKMLEAKTLIPVKGSFILPKDEPVKTKPKITEQKADIVKKHLSDYEKMVQANIAERMKLLESLGIFDDRDELNALQQKPRKPTIHIKKEYHRTLQLIKKMPKSTKKRKRSSIGRRTKKSKTTSLTSEHILTDETQCESQSTAFSGTNKKRKIGIGRIHKKSSQFNNSSQEETEPNISLNLSEANSKFNDNKTKSKYKKYNKSQKGTDRQKKYVATKKGQIVQKGKYKAYVATKKGQNVQKGKYKAYVATKKGQGSK